jgi:hypothetical protein
MFQAAEPITLNNFYHAFTAGLLGLIAVYAVGLLLIGVMALINLAVQSESIARTFRVYIGYGKVLFTVIPLLLLVSVLGLALWEGVGVFSDSADPFVLYEKAGSPLLNHDSTLPRMPLYIIQGTLYALVAAAMAGILAIFFGHFRRLAGLPLAKGSRPKEYLAPVVAMVLYLPSCGLVFMVSIGVLMGFSHGLVAASMHQLSLAPTSLWASVPGMIFAINVSLLFGAILLLFTLVTSLGLRRTFDSWLAKWYSQGDRLIDRPPPMHLHAKAAGIAVLKFSIVAAVTWTLGRLTYNLLDPGVGLSIALMVIQLIAFNAGLGLVRIHKDAYKLFAALTDLFGMHKLYVWTTRNLVVSPQKVESR